MLNNDDEVIFSDEENDKSSINASQPWKLLIVDDEHDIHILTKLVLKGYIFDNKPLEILSAYSGKEAIEIMKTEKNIAVMLLDVVMETDDAGLICAKKIREELNNKEVRIILRTGQPGQAPEHDVIVNYDINDYKAKTDLTSSKLFTTITTSIRSYNYINTIKKNKVGLENIISASTLLFEMQSFSLFAKGILKILTSVLNLGDSLYLNCSSLSAFKNSEKASYNVLAGTGKFTDYENRGIDNTVPEPILEKLLYAAKKKESIFTENTYTGYFSTNRGEITLLFLQWQRALTDLEKELISIFATNISAAFENISRNSDIAESQRKIINTLSEKIESGGKTSTQHIGRLTDLSLFIAKKIGLDDTLLSELRVAAPMHDIGDISTPEGILSKKGILTDEEYKAVKKHTTYGYDMFDKNCDIYMEAAKTIAYQHHEKWDGSGYPRGLKGEKIHILARIVGIADVFESVLSNRSYRDAWSMEKTVDYIKKEKGKHFDPKLVDIIIESLDEVKELMSIHY